MAILTKQFECSFFDISTPLQGTQWPSHVTLKNKRNLHFRTLFCHTIYYIAQKGSLLSKWHTLVSEAFYIMPVTDFIINKYEEWKSLYGPSYDPEFYIRKKTGGIVYVNVWIEGPFYTFFKPFSVKSNAIQGTLLRDYKYFLYSRNSLQMFRVQQNM